MSDFSFHGKTQVTVVEDVVHTHLEGGFNTEGIQNYETLVLQAKPNSANWKLVDHAKDKAGITPEAMIELNRVFKHFIQQGCCCIVEDISSAFAFALEKNVLHDIQVPTLITDSEVEANEFVARC